MHKKHILLTIVITIILGTMTAGFASAYDPPSTNDTNRDNGWAHVNQISVDIGEVELEFVQPRNFFSCFEYRTDGDTSQVIDEEHFLEFYDVVDESEGLQQYPYDCLNTISSLTKIISANEYVEVRMIFGAEGDERFGWTRFDVLPPLPHISCNDDSGTFLEPFDRPIYFKGKKTNRNLPLKFSCVDESGVVVDDEYMVSNGWGPPVVDVAFLASGGDTDPGFEAELLPGGLATDGNQFIYNGEHWMLVLGLKAYTATGVYTIFAVPGDSNYTMDVSETYQKLD